MANFIIQMNKNQMFNGNNRRVCVYNNLNDAVMLCAELQDVHGCDPVIHVVQFRDCGRIDPIPSGVIRAVRPEDLTILDTIIPDAVQSDLGVNMSVVSEMGVTYKWTMIYI